MIDMDDREFNLPVLNAIARAPEYIRERLINAVVNVEDEPSRSLLLKMGIGRRVSALPGL